MMSRESILGEIESGIRREVGFGVLWTRMGVNRHFLAHVWLGTYHGLGERTDVGLDPSSTSVAA